MRRQHEAAVREWPGDLLAAPGRGQLDQLGLALTDQPQPAGVQHQAAAGRKQRPERGGRQLPVHEHAVGVFAGLVQVQQREPGQERRRCGAHSQQTRPERADIRHAQQPQGAAERTSQVSGGASVLWALGSG